MRQSLTKADVWATVDILALFAFSLIPTWVMIHMRTPWVTVLGCVVIGGAWWAVVQVLKTRPGDKHKAALLAVMILILVRQLLW